MICGLPSCLDAGRASAATALLLSAFEWPNVVCLAPLLDAAWLFCRWTASCKGWGLQGELSLSLDTGLVLTGKLDVKEGCIAVSKLLMLSYAALLAVSGPGIELLLERGRAKEPVCGSSLGHAPPREFDLFADGVLGAY